MLSLQFIYGIKKAQGAASLPQPGVLSPGSAAGWQRPARDILRMQIRIFTVPVGSPSGAEEELNGFLACHKVLNIDRQFYQNDAGGAGSFRVAPL